MAAMKMTMTMRLYMDYACMKGAKQWNIIWALGLKMHLCLKPW